MSLSISVSSCGGSDSVKDEEEEGIEEWEEYDTIDDGSGDVIKTLKQEIDSKEEEQQVLLGKIQELESMIEEFKNAPKEKKVVVEYSSSKPDGLYYRIQLGARHMMNGGLNFYEVEKIMKGNISQENGYDKIQMGYYKTYNEAKVAEFTLRKLGIRNTWVVPILNGSRIPVRQAVQMERDYTVGGDVTPTSVQGGVNTVQNDDIY